MIYGEWIRLFADEFDKYTPDKSEVSARSVELCALGDLVALGLEPRPCARAMLRGIFWQHGLTRRESELKLQCLGAFYMDWKTL